MSTVSEPSNPRSPARLSRWMVTGATAAAAVGATAAMDAAEDGEPPVATGAAYGTVARWQGEVRAAEIAIDLMGAADPGPPAAVPPPRVGRADAS